MTTTDTQPDATIGLGDFLDFDVPEANLIMTSPPMLIGGKLPMEELNQITM